MGHDQTYIVENINDGINTKNSSKIKKILNSKFKNNENLHLIEIKYIRSGRYLAEIKLTGPIDLKTLESLCIIRGYKLEIVIGSEKYSLIYTRKNNLIFFYIVLISFLFYYTLSSYTVAN